MFQNQKISLAPSNQVKNDLPIEILKYLIGLPLVCTNVNFVCFLSALQAKIFVFTFKILGKIVSMQCKSTLNTY